MLRRILSPRRGALGVLACLVGLPLAARAQTPAEEPAPASPEAPATEPTPTPVETPPPPAPKPPEAPLAPAKPMEPPAAPVDPEELLREPLVAKLGAVALSPIVLVHALAVPIVGEDAFHQAGDVSERPGFRLRRARFGLRGELAERAAFAVSGELGGLEGDALGVHDAWLGWTPHAAANVYAGAREVPFSRSAMTGAGGTALTDRPLAVRAMAPGNQVGVELEGEVKGGALQYAAGVFNGLQRDVLFYGGYVENYAPAGNRFDGLAYAARLGTEPLGELGRTIDDPDHSPLALGAAGSFFLSDGGTRDVMSAGGDVLLHARGFHLLGEVMWSQSEPESVPTQPTTQVTTITSLALVAEAGYMLVRRRLGVTARFEWIDANQDVADETDDWLVTAGASYRVLAEALKLRADYTHREERAGLSLANDALVLGMQLEL